MQIRDTLVGWWKFPIAKKVRVLYEGYIRVNERGSWQVRRALTFEPV